MTRPIMMQMSAPPKRNAACLSIAAIAGLLVLVAAPAASAHPHVWIATEATVVYENGAIIGVGQKWLFDEFYTASAIQGLDANKDGMYDRSELAELAQVNIDGLKEFAYFTFADLAGQPLDFDAPKDYWLELVEVGESPSADMGPMSLPSAQPDQSNENQGFWARLSSWWSGLLRSQSSTNPDKIKVLALNFTLPLKQPVLAEADGFQLVIQDPSYFIWFEFVKDNPVRLSASAPAGCKADIKAPQGEVRRLSDAFQQFGGAAYGAAVNKAVTVKCPRS